MQDVIGEAAEDGSGRSRRGLLAAAGGGVLALGLSACGSSSDPQTAEAGATDAESPKAGEDLEIVKFALTLEYVEADFYDQVVDGAFLSGEALELAKLIQQNEHEHVEALEALARKIDGKPDERPQTQFPLAGGGARDALRLAARLEAIGAAAYLGQADAIANREVLVALLSIHTIEARHAAGVSRLLGWEFTPDGAFASRRDREEVLDEVRQFII